MSDWWWLTWHPPGLQGVGYQFFCTLLWHSHGTMQHNQTISKTTRGTHFKGS
jgi:hypothetical protein